MDTKRCRRCGIEKPLYEFARHPGWKDGYNASCKQCLAEAAGRTYTSKPPVPEGFKRCSQCGEVKAVGEFHRAASSADGLRSNCKACVARRAGREYRPKEILPEGQKRCTRCGEIFPATDEWFKKDRRRDDGLGTWCKPCASAYTQEYYQDNGESVREYNKRRHASNRDYFSQQHKEWYQNNKAHHRETSKRWREENRDHVREANKKYYLENRDKKIASVRDWRRNNKARYRAYNAEWFENNPEKAAAIRKTTDSRRRARKRELPNTFTSQEWLTCLRYWESQCAVCGDGGKLDADHWIPLADENCLGTVAENMICLCGHCNATKQAQDPVKWLIEKLGAEIAAQTLGKIQAYFEFVKTLKSEE